jgi:hypothetical protein
VRAVKLNSPGTGEKKMQILKYESMYLAFFLHLFLILAGRKKNEAPNIKTSKSGLSSLFNELEVSVQNSNGRKHRVIPFALFYSCIFSNTK